MWSTGAIDYSKVPAVNLLWHAMHGECVSARQYMYYVMPM
jgi:hypothetical protein